MSRVFYSIALAVVAGAALPLPARAQDSLRVGSIFIHNQDVFSPEETGRGWPFRALAGIHATTRASTIRKFLLFR
ncbi:MAG TPA: hypothetical protein VE910_00840, partial [Dongiaceae bacterium]|nr:hypothetical protein [Dongiaceae bacterium]